ncbi:MAG: hypothetical protein ACJ8KU_03945 [Chthoniobacterales bacterium]
MITRCAKFFLIAAAVFALCQTSDAAHRAATEGGRVVIVRSPTFGTRVILQLFIDGHYAARAATGHNIDIPVGPGTHEVIATYSPNRLNIPPLAMHLHVRSGQVYAFTATWDDQNRVVLRPRGTD